MTIAIVVAAGCTSTPTSVREPNPNVVKAYEAGEVAMESLSNTREDQTRAVDISQYLPPGPEQAQWTLKAAAIERERLSQDSGKTLSGMSDYWKFLLEGPLGEERVAAAAAQFEGPVNEAILVSRELPAGSPASGAFLVAAMRFVAIEDVDWAIELAWNEAGRRKSEGASFDEITKQYVLSLVEKVKRGDGEALNILWRSAVTGELKRTGAEVNRWLLRRLTENGEIAFDELWSSYLSGKVEIGSVETKQWLFRSMAERGGNHGIRQLWHHYKDSESSATEVLPVNWVLEHLAQARSPYLRREAFDYYYVNSEMEKADAVAETLIDTNDSAAYKALRSEAEEAD